MKIYFAGNTLISERERDYYLNIIDCFHFFIISKMELPNRILIYGLRRLI